jgi:hypothetical protein
VSRYWVGVASYEHVKAGVAGGFAQLGHGKHAPVQKLSPGDWLVYYSPRTALSGGEPVQAFTAIGKVKLGDAYRVEQSDQFHPFRRDVDYRRSARPAALADLRERLSFTRGRGSHWGMAFRRGSFEISHEDFVLIGKAMKIKPPEERLSR